MHNNPTAKYDIADLVDYFEGKNANEYIFAGSSENLYYNDVDKKFPVERIRPNGYTVYSVNQGGYYYVFWSDMCIDSINIADENPFVYFTAYVSSEKDPLLFETLQIGTSTAEDVKEIDPFFELSFLMSSGIYSYSYLNDEQVLEIEYMAEENVCGYDDLIVKGMAVIPRDNSASRYCTILSEDLPA